MKGIKRSFQCNLSYLHQNRATLNMFSLPSSCKHNGFSKTLFPPTTSISICRYYFSSTIATLDHTITPKGNSSSNTTTISDSQEIELKNFISKELEINSLNDWYKKDILHLIKDKISSSGSSNDTNDNGLLLFKQFDDVLKTRYNNSIFEFLSKHYPDYQWNRWDFYQFVNHPQGFWSTNDNRLEFVNYLCEKLKFDKHKPDHDQDHQFYSQLYKLKKSDFQQYGGSRLIKVFQDSVYSFLCDLYPNYNWEPWMFERAPKKFWGDLNNQKIYINWLGNKLGFKNYNQWYGISKADFVDNNGATLLLLYGGSPVKAVAEILKDKFQWNMWLFTHLPRGMYQDKEIVRGFIEFAKQYYEVTDMDDWYRVSWTQLRDIGGFNLIKKNGGLVKCLQEHYPHHQWDAEKFTLPGKKSSQRLLKLYLQRLFPSTEIHEDYRHESLKFEALSNFPFHLDFFLPAFSLAFEYQGKQHYQDTAAFGQTLIYQTRDKEKRQICAKNNIQIIEIPYWWNNQIDSLIGTILLECPQLSNSIHIQEKEKVDIQNDHIHSSSSSSDNTDNQEIAASTIANKDKQYLPIPKEYQKLSTQKKIFYNKDD
ncbi:hypothetical protein CYY_006644 [Polysphondylium violaceum]|uniref:Uncharacterized protein n=1 Tax=Polysphondylium violaceum TaxID=133409 RepID=A0A8J4PQ95_9MYCE|nr:hypothetical protein CYY_006644 [Polysphondylium violaceum]